MKTILGDLPEFRKNPIKLSENATLNGSRIGEIRLFTRFYYISSDPYILRSILLDDASSWRKGPEVGRLSPAMGEGLIPAEGERWRIGRETLAPAFKPDEINHGLDVGADRLLRGIAHLASDHQTVDLHKLCGHATLVMTIQALFGCHFSSEYIEHVREAVAEGHDVMTQHAAQVVPPIKSKLSSSYRRLMRAVEVLDDIAEYIYYHMDECKMKKALMQLEQLLGYKAVRDEIVTLLVAGFETSANAGAWMLYHMAEKPELMQRLRTQHECVGSKPHEIAKQPLFSGLVKETLRLYPSAWWFARTANRDVAFEERTIPKNASILVVPWALHRNPRLWDAPNTFDPDRWVEKRIPQDRFSWLPFGAGPRACIGRNQAMIELGILAWLATSFDMLPLSGDTRNLKPEGGITLGPPPGSGLYVKMAVHEPQYGRLAA